MKNFYTFIFVIIFCVILYVKSSFAINYEYPYLYKDPRIMGMGGAYVAVGGTFSSLFHNPAGLGKIEKEVGFEVDIIGVTGSIGGNIYDIYKELNNIRNLKDLDEDGDKTDDQLKEVNKLLKKYRGETFHFSSSVFPSIARMFGNLGVGIGVIGTLNFDNTFHQGFGSEGLWTIDASLTVGGIGGMAYNFLKQKNLSIGIGIKGLYRGRIYKSLTAREIVENIDNLDSYIRDQFKTSGFVPGFDIGVIYDFPKFYGFQPSIGFSYLNIGNLDFKEAGKIPSTLNLGVAIKKERDYNFLNRFVVAFDVIDITKNYEEDKDIGKRLRAGVEFSVWSGRWSDFILRCGSYQGYWTAGAELRFFIIRIVGTTYAEEIGAYSGQDENRRYMLSVYITW